MYRKYYLLSYFNKRRFLTKKKLTLLENFNYKKETKLLNVLNKNKLGLNSTNSLTLKNNINIYKNTNFLFSTRFKNQLSHVKTYKKNKYYLDFHKKLNNSKLNKTFSKKKRNLNHVPKILKSFIDNKNQKSYFNKFNSQRFSKINKINLNLKFNNFIYLKYQNIKEKLTKIKLLNRLVKFKLKLNYFYKLIKLLKSKNLNFLWLFLYIKYKQIKFNLVNNNNLSKKIIIFRTLIKTFLNNNTNLKEINKDIYLKTILKFYNLIWNKTNSNIRLNNNNNNYIITLIKPFIKQILSSKFKLKNKFIKDSHNKIFEIFNIKKQLIFLNMFFKILILNIKIILNNNYIKHFTKLLKNDDINLNLVLVNKFNLKTNLSKKLYILKLMTNIKNNNIKLNKELNFVMLDNQKFFSLFKSLSKKYSNSLLLNNHFYKKRFFVWFKLNKNGLKTKLKQRHALNRLKRIKKKLLNKSRWRFLKKNKFERPFNEYWFIPNYIELDLKTLRGGVIKDPTYEDINYSFNLSIKNILNYYKDLGF